MPLLLLLALAAAGVVVYEKTKGTTPATPAPGTPGGATAVLTNPIVRPTSPVLDGNNMLLTSLVPVQGIIAGPGVIAPPTMPGGTPAPTPAPAPSDSPVLDPAVIQTAQTIVNEMLPQIGVSDTTPGPVDGDASGDQFMTDLSLVQKYINANTMMGVILQSNHIPTPLRTDGVLDQSTVNALNAIQTNMSSPTN